MQKLILFFLFCLCCQFTATGQQKSDSIATTFGVYDRRSSSYTTNTGYTFKEGDQIIIGNGSNTNGEFNYITTQSPIVGVIPLKGGWMGSKLIIKEIFLSGSKKRGYIATFKLGTGNIANYYCAIDAALDSKEVILLQKSKLDKMNHDSFSVADEIGKLKKLMDDGALTKEEFEAQKKKILDKE